MRDEVAKVLPVLPHCISAKTVDENQGRLAWVVGLGYPAMHGGSVAKVGGDGAEAGGGEGLTIKPISGSGEAEASRKFRQHGRKEHIVIAARYLYITI